jgi:hypothetical protein
VRGPSLDDVLAVLWGACGVGLAVYFVVLGRENDDMGASPVPPFVFAAVVLAGFSIVAVRHARRGREARAQQRPRAARTPSRPSRPLRPSRPAAEEPRPAPSELSPSGRAALAHVVGVADRAGLFAPRAPVPADLVEAVADAGEPVTLDVVLAALEEAGFWRPGFRAEDHLRALAFHDSHVEQLPDTLERQVADLDRLAGDALRVRLLAVDLADDGGAVRTRLRLGFSTGGGDEDRALDDRALDGRALDYRGDPKYLSTVLHVAVAGALRAAAPDGPWLAWTWSDQGVWLAALRPAALEPFNRELGRALLDPWRWVDAEEPVAAGELRRSR